MAEPDPSAATPAFRSPKHALARSFRLSRDRWKKKATERWDQIKALQAERLAVRDSLDGLKDTVTAESAYQLALGNFDRAAVSSIASGNPSSRLHRRTTSATFASVRAKVEFTRRGRIVHRQVGGILTYGDFRCRERHFD